MTRLTQIRLSRLLEANIIETCVPSENFHFSSPLRVEILCRSLRSPLLSLDVSQFLLHLSAFLSSYLFTLDPAKSGPGDEVNEPRRHFVARSVNAMTALFF